MRLGDLLRSRAANQEKVAAPEPEVKEEQWSEQVISIPIDSVEINRFQPRSFFDEASLGELAASIKEHGILHPMVVRPIGEERYELVVGERRLRACRMLGWDKIPVIVKELDDKNSAELALIENLQREDLNCIEVAEGYRRLLDEFGMTQEQLAQRLGSSQSSIANKLRLLKLPESVRHIVSQEMLGERQARALLSLKSEADQLKALEKIVADGLNVRQTEDLVRKMLEEDKPTQKVRRFHPDVRLLRNSVRRLVADMREGGSVIDFKEQVVDDTLEMVIRIRTEP